MSLNKLSVVACFILSKANVFAQQNLFPKDTIKAQNLEKVVLVHKDNVMSLSKKLFSVAVISKKDIEQTAANNLADVLTQNLNITVTPDASTGKSTVSMFGLDGQYVKILIDGIPIASDNGMGNNIDISQINLEDVNRIEVGEGAMGVLYGDNAVAGVINIVTERRQRHKWQIQASVQEESIGKEYNISDKGRHIQNFKVSNNLNEHINYTLGVSRNNFNGFYNGYQGKDYVNIVDGAVKNDTLRGTEWNPKEQITYFANANINIGKHNIFYKFQYFDESVDVYNRFVTGRKQEDGSLKATAVDETFDTNRIVNNVTITGPLKGETNYNLFLSQQNQKRYYQQYTYNILLQGIEGYNTDAISQSSDVWFSKGFISNIVPNSTFFNLQVGYEFSWQEGFDAIATGDYSNDVVVNTLNNYDFFSVADFYINKRLSLYPGARITNNSQFGNKFIWSLSSIYKITDSFNTKAVFGSAFRAPNFTELFYYFVDANHNVQGNKNLQPEDGISILLNFNKSTRLTKQSTLKTALKGYYFDIDNKIGDITIVEEDGSNLFTYANIDNSKIAGISLDNTYSYKNLSLGLGATYMGESTTISTTDTSNSDYLWSYNIQSNINYKIPSIKTTFSGQIKYTGRTQVLLGDNTGSGAINIGQTDSFTWLDASVRKDITQNINLTFGARNILDVVTVNASDVAAEGHSNPANNRLFGNGRSYFLKLLINLNLN
ncbi:outer membrane receptor for ferrienterochelin and colicins [Wenyingzhuangia heitensis]|uniref:Outer membrane receptor for ferrienterochelin and colicins n=1 Tax=Wenyingzhuangia heitensis TaxID=1487859 RepID=A0ABX0UDT4_9FLAO|nr:TonB-dependent receptor [Wenyingzhuangia heitensis]NIJ45681.1 outer membrane receptor for ferrienterochelin and colicins [Wenyingzhuangia heitensis]